MKQRAGKLVSVILVLAVVMSSAAFAVVGGSALAGQEISVNVNEIDAAPNEIVLDMPGKSVIAGQEFTVDININHNPGIAAMILNIGFDTSLTLISAEATDVLGTDVTYKNTYKAPYIISWNVNSEQDENYSGLGKIATLTFKASESISASTDSLITVSLASKNNALSYDSASGILNPLTLSCTGGGCNIGIVPIKFRTVSVSLSESLSLKYKVDKTLVNLGATDFYAVFDVLGEMQTVIDYTDDGTNLVFVCKGIPPHAINTNIVATLHARVDGEDIAAAPLNYSVKAYCDAALRAYPSNTKLRTLLVDLLNYGAESQNYVGYETGNLANKDLTTEQQGYATQERIYDTNNVINYDSSECSEVKVTWKSVGLRLEDSIAFRFKITCNDISGVKMKVNHIVGGHIYTVEASDFVAVENQPNTYYVFFNGLNASAMRDNIFVYFADNDNNHISTTARLQIESCAHIYKDSEDVKLSDLALSILKYGDAAVNYLGTEADMNNITFDKAKIDEITHGAVNITESGNEFGFYRFTPEQLEAYSVLPVSTSKRAYSSAGVRFEFVTDADRISFDYHLEKATPYSDAQFDVYVNGRQFTHFGTDSVDNNWHTATINMTYDDMLAAGTDESMCIGRKSVIIYMPWSMITKIRNFVLHANYFEPTTHAYTAVFYGDSITNGNKCTYASNLYSAETARKLDLDFVNKGVGSDSYSLAPFRSISDPVEYDYVFIAYGTNDWTTVTESEFRLKADDFFNKITAQNPNAGVFVISPIWRTDHGSGGTFGCDLVEVDGMLREIAEPYSHITVVNGWDLVTKSSSFYFDSVHPNDNGAICYADLLTNQVSKYIG